MLLTTLFIVLIYCCLTTKVFQIKHQLQHNNKRQKQKTKHINNNKEQANAIRLFIGVLCRYCKKKPLPNLSRQDSYKCMHKYHSEYSIEHGYVTTANAVIPCLLSTKQHQLQLITSSCCFFSVFASISYKLLPIGNYYTDSSNISYSSTKTRILAQYKYICNYFYLLWNISENF